MFELALHTTRNFVSSVFSLVGIPLHYPSCDYIDEQTGSIGIDFGAPAQNRVTRLMVSSAKLGIFNRNR